jgi:hypothetical protein
MDDTLAAAIGSLDEQEQELRAQLLALPESASGFARSALATLGQLRRERTALRQSLGLIPARPPISAPADAADLGALRDAASDLAFGYAEAVALASAPRSVGLLVEHLEQASRLLAVVELWIEEEGQP